MGPAAKDDNSFQKPHTSKTKEVGLGLGVQSREWDDTTPET